MRSGQEWTLSANVSKNPLSFISYPHSYEPGTLLFSNLTNARALFLGSDCKSLLDCTRCQDKADSYSLAVAYYCIIQWGFYRLCSQLKLQMELERKVNFFSFY